LGKHAAVLPIDPVSDGTWIAASDAELVTVLMNVYAPGDPIDLAALARASTNAALSRGRIIPSVLEADDLVAAQRRSEQLDHVQFQPFRLVLFDNTHLVECVWSKGRFMVEPVRRIDRPMFFTSSGLGDAIVAGPRRALFEEMFAPGADWVAAQ